MYEHWTDKRKHFYVYTSYTLNNELELESFCVFNDNKEL